MLRFNLWHVPTYDSTFVFNSIRSFHRFDRTRRNLWDDLISSWRLPYCDGIYVVDSCILIGTMEVMGGSEAERYKKKKVFNLERSWVLASDTKICIFSNYVCCTSKDSVYLWKMCLSTLYCWTSRSKETQSKGFLSTFVKAIL